MGMGIPTGFPYGWEFILAYGNSTCGNPMENRHSHIWESCGKSSFPYVGIPI